MQITTLTTEALQLMEQYLAEEGIEAILASASGASITFGITDALTLEITRAFYNRAGIEFIAAPLASDGGWYGYPTLTFQGQQFVNRDVSIDELEANPDAWAAMNAAMELRKIAYWMASNYNSRQRLVDYTSDGCICI